MGGNKEEIGDQGNPTFKCFHHLLIPLMKLYTVLTYYKMVYTNISMYIWNFRITLYIVLRTQLLLMALVFSLCLSHSMGGFSILDPQVISNVSRAARSKPQSAGAPLHRISTPFERKRNQEVTLLNKKVEANLSQQIEQTGQLKAFKKSIAEQEYEVTLESLKRKLEITKHQLSDQHAYTVRLQQQTTDADLIEQEQLVKRQLQKRVDRMEGDLNSATKRLSSLQKIEEDAAASTSNQFRTVKDKFSNMTKKDGSLDAVKVKSTLQQQEKLQNKLQKKIDRQTALVIDKHLEIQEMSTRQKLEAFKRKLADSRQGERANGSESVQSTAAKDMRHKERETSTKQFVRNVTEHSVSAVKVEEKKGTPAHDSFQRRIQDEKISREHSINEILSKYRSGSGDAQESARAMKRTAQVDQILAKYNDNRNTHRASKTKTTTTRSSTLSSNSTTNSSRSVHGTSMSATVTSERKREAPKASEVLKRANTTIVQNRIRVPNSAMEYNAAVINSALQQKAVPKNGSKSDLETRTVKQNSVKTNIENRRDFQSTLESMLETRPDRHKRRTDAWVGSGPTQKATEEQNIGQAKTQHYLSQQYKKKRGKVSTPQGKDRPGSQTVSTKSSSASSNSKTPANRIHSSHNLPTNRKEFSHRISHYQKDSNNGNLSEKTKDNSFGETESPPELDTAAQTVLTRSVPTVAIQTKEYTSLKKLTKRNEHTSQVRRIQNAAIKIQRMWRRHSRRTRKK